MKETPYQNSRKNFFLKVILPSVFTFILFIITFYFFIIPSFETAIMDRKREMIKELTNSVWSVLLKYEMEEKKGMLTLSEAQEKAREEIKQIRYGDEMKDYFWITDMHPNMIMHPYRSELDGKSLKEFKDPHGKKLFVEFVEIVKKQNEGYTDYMWQWKDDSLRIVPKLSYVKLFKPWNWIIGTGIYIEDVKKEIRVLTRKLITISFGILLLVAFLLFFISQQSFKIERKRIEAEHKLQESKEKYRKLVEAATEGLVMLIDGKISFLNNVICKMTGYSDEELMNVPILNLLSSNNNNETIEIFSKKIINEGQYEISLKKKNGELMEALVTSSKTTFSNDVVNILIIKDITIDRTSDLSVIEYQKLIGILNIGFFRAKIDFKGKFIFANETAIKILGYESFRELSDIYILELLASKEDRKNLRNELIAKGYIKNKKLKIIRKNSESATVSVTLIIVNRDNPRELICDGIIEDITSREKEIQDLNNLILELKSNTFLMEQSVGKYATTLYTLDFNATIDDVLNTLQRKKTDALLLTKNNSDYIGIITNSDLKNRLFSFHLKTDNPAYLIMSSPIYSINENTTVSEALHLCEELKINHLPVKNASGQYVGIFRSKDVYTLMTKNISFYIKKAESAESYDELKQLHKNMQLLIAPFIKSGMHVKYITQSMSLFTDAVIRKIISLNINELGEPPASFSFICMGSEGRKEETLLTDQDNAIIYDDVPKENAPRTKQYFLDLGEKICDALHFIGYSYCMGKIMAKNPQWCKPYSEWVSYFTGWISTPEPKNLLEATIFFDFRNIYGEEIFVKNLRTHISTLIKEYPVFLYHMAHNTFNIKTQHIPASNIIADRSTEIINLKEPISLLVMIVRTYCLQNEIWDTNTFERLEALKNKNILSVESIDEIAYMYNFLMSLRLKNQVRKMESQQELTNTISTKDCLELELVHLKKILSHISVYQNKIATDFRINT